MITLNFEEKLFSSYTNINPEGRKFYVITFHENEYIKYNSFGYSLDEARDAMIKLLGELNYFEEV